MKTLKLLLPVIAFITGSLQAQVSINVNLGNPPPWGPAGYTEVRYYYIPDIDSYYDVGTRQFIYINNGRWVRAASLPVVYRNYDLYNGYKVVVTDYRGATPYIHYKVHKHKYPHGYKTKVVQKTIGRPPGHAKKAVVVPHPGGDKVLVNKGGKNQVKAKGKGKKH
jgi:hypothetical protein